MCAPGAHFLEFLRKGVPKSHPGAHFLAFSRVFAHGCAPWRAFSRICVLLVRIFSHFCARVCQNRTVVRIFSHFCAWACTLARIFAHFCAYGCPWRAFSRIFAHGCAPSAHFLAFLRTGVPKSHPRCAKARIFAPQVRTRVLFSHLPPETALTLGSVVGTRRFFL